MSQRNGPVAGKRRGEVVYSHSRLASFEQCPKKFEYRYVLRIPSESESIEGFVGKRVHEVLERLYLFAARGLVPSLARVLQRYRALFDEHYDAERVRVARAEVPLDHYRENGERCLDNFYRRHYPFDADETLAVEQHVSFDLDETSGYRVQGIVDRIVRARDGALEVHDYKTGKRVPSQQDLDRDRQLAFYQMGVARRYGDDQPIRLVWHYLLRDQVRTSTRTPDQLDRLRRESIELIDRIRAETVYEPRPGPLCGWCEYRDRCPAQAREAGEAGPRRSGEDVRAPSPASARGNLQLPLL